MTIYAILKLALYILAFVFFLASVGVLSWGIITKKTSRIIGAVVLFFLAPACILVSFMVAVKQYSFDINECPAFEVASKDINEGFWDVKISHDKGSDLSPELTWQPVEGATSYAVYMLDITAGNWVHMKTSTDKTSLASGEVSEYVGPYPPSGVHDYVIYVFALKEAKGLPEVLDAPSDGVKELASMLNTFSNSDVGNIVAIGRLEASYPG